MPWDPVSEEEPAPEDLPPKKPASRKPASKKDIAAQNTSPPAPAANSGPAPVSEKAPSSPSAAILKPAFDKVSSPSLAAIPDPTTPVRDLRYSIDQSSGCHAKSLDITTSEAALNPVYSESFQIGHSDAQEERPAEDNEGDGGAADEAGSVSTLVSVLYQAASSISRSMRLSILNRSQSRPLAERCGRMKARSDCRLLCPVKKKRRRLPRPLLHTPRHLARLSIRSWIILPRLLAR